MNKTAKISLFIIMFFIFIFLLLFYYFNLNNKEDSKKSIGVNKIIKKESVIEDRKDSFNKSEGKKQTKKIKTKEGEVEKKQVQKKVNKYEYILGESDRKKIINKVMKLKNGSKCRPVRFEYFDKFKNLLFVCLERINNFDNSIISADMKIYLKKKFKDIEKEDYSDEYIVLHYGKHGLESKKYIINNKIKDFNLIKINNK